MRQSMFKFFTIVLSIILCVSCLSACGNNNKVEDAPVIENTDTTNTPSEETNSPQNQVTEGFYVDETTGDIIDASTGETTTDKNIKVDETTGNIVNSTTGETIQTKEETDKIKEEVNSKPTTNTTKKPETTSKPENTTTNTGTTKPEDTTSNKTENSTTGKQEETTGNKQEETTSSKPTDTTTTACKHKDTKVINKKSATCTTAGYTGDTYCNTCKVTISKGSSIAATGHKNTTIKNKTTATCTNTGYTGDTCCTACNAVIKKGSTIAATGHVNTEVRNKKEATTSSAGYTGDTYCKQCGKKIATGQSIPKLDDNNGKVEYIFPDGSSLWIEPGGDIIGTLMAQKTKKVNHLYLEVEKEILRLCNIEREKAGLKPLAWFEDAYCFTQVRAEEASKVWSHTRPNGTNWATVYTDAGVFLIGSSGENLFETVGYSITEYAAIAVEGWMNSPGHRANILNPKFTRVAIAIAEHGSQLTAAQNFFS